MNINEYLEDFDNAELDKEEWTEVMEDKVRDYNDEYQTSYAPRSTVKAYIEWKFAKNLTE